MKKILVVFMILAVAGGVFAQEGKWSLVGTVEIGTRITIDPVVENGGPDKDAAVARVNGIGYNWWDVPRIKVDFGYNREGLSAGFQMNTRADNEIYAAFSGQNFKARGSVYGIEDLIFMNNDTNGGSSIKTNGFDTSGGLNDDNSIKRLWGEYYVLDGLLTLGAAYKSEELRFWESDLTGTFFHAQAARPHPLYESQNWRSWFYMNHGFFDNFKSFTHVDGHNYFLANIKLSGLELGAIVPNVYGNGRNGTSGQTRPQNAGNELVEDALKGTIIGAKFNMQPVELATQFKMRDYGAYFGGKFSAGPVGVGLSFQGILKPEEKSSDNKRIKIGGNIDYNAGAFGANVAAYLDKTDFKETANASASFIQVLGVQPSLFYHVIPSHLGFKLTTGFYFLNETTYNTNETNVDKDFVWAIEPQLFWNFRGTGARTSYAWANSCGAQTGMMMRFRTISPNPAAPLVKDSATEHKGVTFLDIIFSWQF
jgi:hypothetical protein